MISITPLAQEKLSVYLAESKITHPQVRIYISSDCGCNSDGQIVLGLDKLNTGDISAAFGDLTIFMSRDLYEQVGQVLVDFKDNGQEAGFVVESERPAPISGCASCTSCE